MGAADMVDNLAQCNRIGHGNDYCLRALELRPLKVARVLGRALNYGDAAQAQVATDAWVYFDHHERETAPFESRSDEPPYPAETDDDGVPPSPRSLVRNDRSERAR